VLRLILTILVVGAGTAPPTRTVIDFGTAAVGPRSAFSSVHHFGVTIVAHLALRA
jgi:hypothetical protein